MMGQWLRASLSDLRDRSLWRWGAAGLTAVALVLLLMRSEQPVTSPDAEDLRGPDKPDGFVINATYRSFDEQGRLSTRMTSARGEQFDEDKRVTMESPRGLLLEKASRAPWHLAAETGEYYLNRERLTLSGSVRIRHETRERGEALLKTERLIVDNRKRIVHTDAPVTIINRSSLTRATGMKGWIDDRVLELENQVDGYYYSR